MKIGQISDIHIRFASRHDEYRQVFERLYADLKQQKPSYIICTGDLVHQKVSISPNSINLAAEFLANLGKIAPCQIILGNHDINLAQKEQGDAISAILETVNKFNDSNKKTFIVTEENKNEIDFSKKGIYFFPDSGFYNISDNLVYGVYSCKDNKILNLTEKEIGKKYISLYHGQIYGARGDNGYELRGDNLLGVKTFNNFDICCLGDIHQHQTFRDDESMAYAGKLIQGGYGESIDSGYLLWDLEKNSFQFRHILNDYGFAKINIAKGEIIEERLDSIKFSNDKRKTKVHIVWEDFEENYSLEKEQQIIKSVKDKHGCEVVKVEFSPIEKQQKENTDIEDSKNEDTFLQLLSNFIKNNDFDCDDEFLKEIIEFASVADRELEIEEKKINVKIWDLDSIEISNLFSFPVEPTIIPFEQLRGITGIFGKNFSGKSNVLRAIVWILYQHILGSGDPKKLVNIYTPSNKGYGKAYLTINGEKYYIKREVITKVNAKGESSNSYPVEYKKLVIDENGKETWVSELSEKAANEKREVKNLIFEALGTVDDFTKVSLQTQDGKENYINQQQQPKNDLVNRYLGLEHFRDRYDYVNKSFNDVKRKQKEIGDIKTIESSIVEIKSKTDLLNKEIINLNALKGEAEKSRDEVDAKMLKLSKTIKSFVPLTSDEFNDKEDIDNDILRIQGEINDEQTKYDETLEWTANNFKKELPFDEGETLESIKKQYLSEEVLYNKDVKTFQSTDEWLKNNPKKDSINIEGYDVSIQDLNVEISNLNSKLPTYRGEKCPTCGHISKEPNPEMYQKCLDEISKKNNTLKQYRDTVASSKNADMHNNKFDLQLSNVENLKLSITAGKNKMQALKDKGNLIVQSKDIVAHNASVEQNNKLLTIIANSINSKTKNIEKLNANIIKLQEIEICKKHNSKINVQIEDYQEQIKGYKLTVYNLNQQAIEKSGDLRIEKNNLENFEQKLGEIKSAEQIYKKYSIYLQAVHRDGIPSMIIRKKIPIINNKINSILSSIVDFKIELNVLVNGDIVECFYFSNDKSDALSLSAASGSQKFIASIVIKDALHYISNLIKPSINIIDEGFGSLDDELISGIVTVLQYLKNKYKNVLIVTHRNEVKDFVDNIIEVCKMQDGIAKEIIDKNEHVGITKIGIS